MSFRISKQKMITRTLIWVLVMLKIVNFTKGADKLNTWKTVKQWKVLSFNIPSEEQAIDNNFYNPENVFITGIAISKDRIFIATPRIFSGVPTTLSYVLKIGFGDSPVLQAYPDWSFSTSARNNFNCSDLILVSVYQIRIDSCNRLWVLDSGISRSLEEFKVTCPPKILVFDLNMNHVVKRIDFPPKVLQQKTLFINFIIDETTSRAGTCDDVFVYISDAVEPAIVVYDGGHDDTWRGSFPTIYLDEEFDVEKAFLNDGILGLTIIDENLFYQPLGGNPIYSINTEVLRNGPFLLNYIPDIKLIRKKSSQGISLTLSLIDGSLFIRSMIEKARATNKQTIVALNQEQLYFVLDIESSPFDIVTPYFHR